MQVAESSLNPGIVRVHRIFYIAYFAFAIIFALLGAAQLFNGHPQDARMGLIGLVIVPVGLVHWCAARGARQGKRWGRILSSVIALVLLFGFPIGTVAGIYLFAKLGSDWQPQSPEQPAVSA
jgi:hypothetical protein